MHRLDELGDAERLDVALRGEAQVALDVDLDPQALAVEAVLVALVLAQHRVEPLVEVLVRAAPGVVDAHRVVGGDRPVEEAPAGSAGVLRPEPRERAAAPPTPGAGRAPGRRSRVGWRRVRTSGLEGRGPRPGPGLRAGDQSIGSGAVDRPRGPASRRVPARIPAGTYHSARCRHPQRAPRAHTPRTRSAFAAAFLSLIFPGLGHAYAGAYPRALAFAALPFLLIALAGGIFLRVDRLELVGFVVQPQVLAGIFVVNILILIYRIVAAVDAWNVARYLNEVDASGGGHLGKSKLPLSPLSIAGLLAVLIVIGGAHIAVARYDLLAYDLVNCVFSETDDLQCEAPADTPGPRRGQRAQRVAGRERGADRVHRPARDAHQQRPGHDRARASRLGRQGAAEHPARRASTSARARPSSTPTP